MLAQGTSNFAPRSPFLDSYNAQFQGENDFLGLNNYVGNLPRFIGDLRDPNNTLTASVSGLLASEATQFYKYHMTPAGWDFLNDDQKAAAITQYYVRGPEKLTQEAAGQPDNADVLRAALGYNTYPLNENDPQSAPPSIGSSGNSSYAYVSAPTSMPQNALTIYAQGQPASVSNSNALIPLTSANGPAYSPDPTMLATMALIRAFGLPPGTDITQQSPAQP